MPRLASIGCRGRGCLLIPALLLLSVSAAGGQSTSGPPAATAFAIFGGTTITAGGIGGRFVLVDTLRVRVTSSVSYDHEAAVFRYSYTVMNDSNSQGCLQRFEIRPLRGDVSEIQAPAHWTTWDRHGALVWTVIDLGEPPSDWIDDGVDIPPSEFCISPGDSLAGFGFISLFPEAMVQFSVYPWEPLRNADEEGAPECPYRAVGEAFGPGAAAEQK